MGNRVDFFVGNGFGKDMFDIAVLEDVVQIILPPVDCKRLPVWSRRRFVLSLLTAKCTNLSPCCQNSGLLLFINFRDRETERLA